jgi:RNA polymerase sigma factor (sigma-70 family)
MITIKESQDLMEKFIGLRKIAEETKSDKDILSFKKHERLCIEKFTYLITMKTNRYKAFSNYDDLNQEGMEALVKAMKNYNPEKGLFFWWGHHYIGTRISRSANLHTTIRVPLKVAKITPPHKEAILPLLIEEKYCPDKELEAVQDTRAIFDAMNVLNAEQKNIINLAFGFDDEKPLSINKICKRLGISRLNCIKSINGSLAILKDNIKL